MAEEVFLEEFATAQSRLMSTGLNYLNRVNVYMPPKEGSRDGSSSYEAARSVGVLDIRESGLGSFR